MSAAFIIDPTISSIEGLRALLGIGVPNDGGILYSSLSFFEKALEDLASAFPGDSWLGSAADKYAGKNHNHVNFFQELADLDRDLISLIHDEAGAIQTARDVLEGAIWTLKSVRSVAVDMTYIPVVGYAMSAAFQAQVCAAAMAAVGGGLAYLLVKAAINTAKFVALLARLAKLLAAAVADTVADISGVVNIVKVILEEVGHFITGALAGLKNLWDKLAGWISRLISGLFSHWLSSLHSLFGGIPGLSSATSGLSQVTGLFSAAGLSGSSGLTSAESLASSADLPSLVGIAGGSGLAGLPQVAQLHVASVRQGLRPRGDGPAETSAEQLGRKPEPVSAQGPQGMGGSQGMGSMCPSSAKSKDATTKTKKYSEGAAAGTDDAERAPVEVESGGGTRVVMQHVV
ncbi:secretion protein EspA [Mycobacterium uberis]|uniref:Secretion protein EspA n=1 Tax=Mycobacterium uberis TaxID=2162698 RepID=A0A3E1HBM0_9MYCO|nr:EspA/EspE family type VII secretion system effector [Mycobacterium uberis]RFD23871.1 secretion protein EspA [Mycobacterium uberis]